MYSETKKEKAEKEIILPIQIPQNNLDNFPNLMMFYEHDHKFIFEKNPELLNDLQHHIQKYLSNENKYFFIHRSFPEKILKDLIYLKEYQKNISEKEENYNLMLKNYTILTQQISNQDSIIKQIENTYIDKINDLKIELAEFKEKLERIHEEKHTFKEKLRKEKFELAQKLDYETENSKKLLELVKVTVRENTILKEEIGQLRKNLEMFTLMKKENVLLGQKIVIENVLKTNLFFEISKYLETSDILNLQQMNKSIFFGISLNSKLISTVTRNLNKKYKKKLNKLESKLSFCNKKLEEIPDDYLKSSILKFLCLEFKIADLIPHVLKKSQILIEKDVIFFKEEVSTSNNVIEFLEAPTVKANINDLKINLPNSLEEKSKETALDELSNPSTIKNEEVSEKSQKKKQEESEKSSNFFKNFFRKSNSKSDQTKIEDGLSENIKEKRKIVDKLHLETILYTLKKLSTYSEIAINQDFLKNFEKENYNFKSKIETQMKNLHKNLLGKINDYEIEENYEKLKIFFNEFLRNFCEMILFSSILLQESKELETVKYFLLACNEKAHIDLFNLQDKYDDVVLEKYAEKKLKEFLSTKSKELEKKIHENDSLIYKNNETIMNLSNQISNMESKIKELTEDKTIQMNKMKTLANEVKNLRNKNEELDSLLKTLVKDCLEIKIQFEKIPMDV